MLGVSRSWLYLAVADGRIPHLRLGSPDGPLRFREDEIVTWLDVCRRAWRPGATLRDTIERASTLRGDAPRV